jgi:exopolysaccharide biosynthesis polyprenyl glycosylphosphotransferase
MPSVLHEKSNYFARLILMLDLLIGILVFMWLLELHPRLFVRGDADYTSHLGVLAIILPAFLGLRLWFSQKPSLSLLTPTMQAWIVLREQVTLLIICMSMIFLFKLSFVSRFVIVGYFLINSIALVCARLFIVWWYFDKDKKNKENFVRVLIVGSGRRARMLADQLQAELEWGVSIVGFLDPEGRCAGRRKDDEILGHVTEISRILQANVVDEVIVAVPRAMVGDVQAIVDACQEEGVKLRFMADLYDFNAARLHLVSIKGIPLLTFEPVAMSDNSLIAKRIFDILIVLAAAPLLIPLFAIIALGIKIDSPGPVFFTQERVGLHKRRFRMYKFRSMVPDAEALMKDLEHLNEVQGPNFKIRNDPRVTRIGRFLRKSSLDELPQLINVLCGDMSLVGPRPMSLRDVERFDKGIQRKRFSARPGLTCIWQISGRSDLDFDHWLKLDLDYIDHSSFWLDLKILFRTIPSVLKGSGAV